MTLLQNFISHTNKHNLFTTKDKLLLAVSGGVDSTVLCELCHLAGYDFVIAHCNFTLRGEESTRDEYFVQQLAIKYNVSYFIKVFDTITIAKKNKTGVSVTCIEPGFVKSKMAKSEKLFWVVPVNKAAKQIIKAIEKRKRKVYISRRWWLIAKLMRWMPYWIYRKIG